MMMNLRRYSLMGLKNSYDFQVSERREAKNLKELLAKSNIATLEVEDQNGGSQPCNKNCAYCEKLRKTASHELKS